MIDPYSMTIADHLAIICVGILLCIIGLMIPINVRLVQNTFYILGGMLIVSSAIATAVLLVVPMIE